MTQRTIALICVWTLPSALCVAAAAIVYSAFRLPPPDRLDVAERAAVIAPLRAVIEPGAVAAPASQALHRPLAGPLAVTVWLHGRAALRVDATGADLAAATAKAAELLAAQPVLPMLSASDRAEARIQVDLVSGRGPLGGGNWLFDQLAIPGIADMLPVNPGIDGIGADIAGQSILLLPHELVGNKLLAAKRPFDALPDFAIGVDMGQVQQLIAARATQAGPVGQAALYRFRTDSFVEPLNHTQPPLPLYRGLPPPPELSGQTLREAALQGGRYLVAQLASNGRYSYEHDLATGVQTDPLRAGTAYSLPRHAGATYFLAELYRITREPWLREPIERAFAHLADLLAQGHCGGQLPDGAAFDCVLDRGETVAHLGSTALTVVALVEYQRATGDTRYLPLATRLSAWILSMQRSDGSFRHQYYVRTHKPDETTQLLYYSGEAALALARMYTVTHDVRYRDATQRALDWLVDWYDFFMGGFMYGEEHWTCIAAEAIWPAVARDKYMAFCHGYGAFLRTQQPATGDDPDEDDYAGSYNISPFIAPSNTPAGSRTEAMISAYLLGKHHGAPDREIAGQIRAALRYVLRQQIRPDSDFNALGVSDGALPATPVDRNVRIDYIQHVCSAMLRASEWIDREP